uniref:RING-type domain-containing protein n=1 Tax=Oryza meridionalis TaxID=40149 RepID=A0A0E0F4Y6_9ORYZ
MSTKAADHERNMDTKEKRVNIATDESYTVTFHCAICMEYKPMNSRFRCEGCPHYFCFKCVLDHISYRVLGGDAHVCCLEPGCTIGELTYEKWYKHVRGDVRKAWESANLRDSAMLKRCGSCGKFLEGFTLDWMEGGRDDCLDPLHTLAIAKGWRPCPRCGIFIELTGGCSIVTCRLNEIMD